MKKIIIFLLMSISFSCSKKNDSIPLDSIGSSFVKSQEIDELSIENYSAEANEILEKHKKKLKIVLPRLIEEEVGIYKNVLFEIEKAPIKNTTYYDTNQYIKQEVTSLENKLMKKELILNEVYFQLFNELSVLNYKYRLFKKGVNFIDFYEAGPIVLSDEVLIKIEEMIKDEKIRLELEKNASNSQKAALGIDAIISAFRFTKCGKTLKNIAASLRVANNRELIKSGTNVIKYLKSDAKPLSKAFYVLLNKNLSNKTISFINNQKKRDNISTKSEIGLHSANLVGMGNAVYQYDLLNSFKELNNKINGRIGDFSDGILAVHLQRVREIIKANKAMLVEDVVNHEKILLQ